MSCTGNGTMEPLTQLKRCAKININNLAVSGANTVLEGEKDTIIRIAEEEVSPGKPREFVHRVVLTGNHLYTNVGWVVDGDMKKCMSCRKADFGLFTWKHHCRMCGDLVCQSCSGKRVKLSKEWGLQHEEGDGSRVCVKCYTDHVFATQTKDRTNSTTGSNAKSIKNSLEEGKKGSSSKKEKDDKEDKENSENRSSHKKDKKLSSSSSSPVRKALQPSEQNAPTPHSSKKDNKDNKDNESNPNPNPRSILKQKSTKSLDSNGNSTIAKSLDSASNSNSASASSSNNNTPSPTTAMLNALHGRWDRSDDGVSTPGSVASDISTANGGNGNGNGNGTSGFRISPAGALVPRDRTNSQGVRTTTTTKNNTGTPEIRDQSLSRTPGTGNTSNTADTSNTANTAASEKYFFTPHGRTVGRGQYDVGGDNNNMMTHNQSQGTPQTPLSALSQSTEGSTDSQVSMLRKQQLALHNARYNATASAGQFDLQRDFSGLNDSDNKSAQGQGGGQGGGQGTGIGPRTGYGQGQGGGQGGAYSPLPASDAGSVASASTSTPVAQRTISVGSPPRGTGTEIIGQFDSQPHAHKFVPMPAFVIRASIDNYNNVMGESKTVYVNVCKHASLPQPKNGQMRLDKIKASFVCGPVQEQWYEPSGMQGEHVLRADVCYHPNVISWAFGDENGANFGALAEHAVLAINQVSGVSCWVKSLPQYTTFVGDIKPLTMGLKTCTQQL